MKIAIIGGGVGGLTLSLKLLKAGIRDIHLYESSNKINELGVGINILPHAMRELEELGLMDKLLAASAETSEMKYYTQQGDFIWKEYRGKKAGYHWPQISIHRGKLINILYQAVVERLGNERIHINHKLKKFEQNKDGSVTAYFNETSVNADLLIGCDGIHSAVRAQLYPNEGSPKWGGVTMWRGTSLIAEATAPKGMIIAGRSEHRIVIYPISQIPNKDGKILVNWVAEHKTDKAQAMPKDDWVHSTEREDIPKHFENFNFVNYNELLNNSSDIYKYPQVDRDPLPSWDFTNTTLLGDAAHPMYPSGSNGASQSILDASVLTQKLVTCASIGAAIHEYDGIRRPDTSNVVLNNRQAGPEKCIDIVEQRAPTGFDNLNEVISHDELQEIASAYKKIAGFSPEILNNRKSYQVVKSL